MIINNTRNVSSLNQKWLLISRTLVEISVLMDWTKIGKNNGKKKYGKGRWRKNKGMDETRDTVRRREKKEDGKKW